MTTTADRGDGACISRALHERRPLVGFFYLRSCSCRPFLGPNTGVSLFQQEHTLNNGHDNANSGDEIRQEIGVLSKDALLGKRVGVVFRRLREEASHSRANDTTKSPDEGLRGVCSCCTWVSSNSPKT